MSADWLAAVLPANQKPDLKSLLINMDFDIRHIFRIIYGIAQI